MPSHWTVKVTWKQYLVAASICAKCEEDRAEITYEDFANMMTALGFEPHETLRGTLRPPSRFKQLPNGKKALCFNPCERSLQATMTFSLQGKVQTLLRDFYDIDLANFTFERKPQWEQPADPTDPVPIEDPHLFDD
ncbi:hypothetical protein C8T65DRAFT_743350 [Cerioporus squamosus]|nr:hypothetical protein C8T65DRAFT_748816 [Cerioporus squamosus]KAI0697112.1 hypothetical protein C8T65DRAFT_743350 [Cerioporus squamosus]